MLALGLEREVVLVGRARVVEPVLAHADLAQRHIDGRVAGVQREGAPEGIRGGAELARVLAARGARLALVGLEPERLELEITETSLLENQEAHLATIRQLKNLGISLALDDFGTGFSSLSYLTRMRFDKIKIDKHFISELRSDPNSSLAVLRSVVALAKSLGIATVAEGVETQEQLDRVRQEGCTEAQGFYIGLPMSAAGVTKLLAGRKRRTPRPSKRAS